MGKKLMFIITGFILFGAAAHGQTQFPVPDVDPLSHLLTLIQDGKAMGPLALGMGGIVLVMQILKKFVGDFPYKRVVVTVLAVAYALGLAVTGGATWLEAAVAVFVTGGGAVAIYEAWKGVSKAVVKPKPAGLQLPK